MTLRTAFNFLGDRLHTLPLAIVYVTERCNSRCITCDFWRNGRDELSPARASVLAHELSRLGTRAVLLTGGEVLSHPEWAAVARAFREQGQRIWLLTAGLSLDRASTLVAELSDRVTVSLDGATPESYLEIRGVSALDRVLAGVDTLVRLGTWVSLRTVVQRRNYKELPELILMAKNLGVRQISFFPVDTGNRVAFARDDGGQEPLALSERDLPLFGSVLDTIERDFSEELRSGFVAESMPKLRRMHRYFSALAGHGEFPPVRCNAPRFSAVVRADGGIQPCHFIEPVSRTADWNDEALVALRREIRRGGRGECARCVCPMWKGLPELALGGI